MSRAIFTHLSKSVLHNIGVVLVGLGVALVGTWIDTALGLSRFQSDWTAVAGSLLLALGFAVRVWATFHFYTHGMKVISLTPQRVLLTSGPYRFSRNPLYLGGNVFIFFGAALLIGSPAAVMITVLHLPVLDLFIRREERQLAAEFGDEWRNYSKRVRRWM